MTSPRSYLALAEAKIAGATTQLELALQRANQLELPPDFIAAIKKALADNQATWLHVANITTLLKLPGAPLI